MATATERQRLRLDLGLEANDTDTLSDAEADAILAEAGETYTDSVAAGAHARVIAIRRMLASSAKLTSYRQNNSSEEASDVFKHLKELLLLWQDNLADAVAGTRSVVRFGRTTRIPARIKEHPGW